MTQPVPCYYTGCRGHFLFDHNDVAVFCADHADLADLTAVSLSEAHWDHSNYEVK